MSEPELPAAAHATESTEGETPPTGEAQPEPPKRTADDSGVPDKQIYRWKDDGGALPPGS